MRRVLILTTIFTLSTALLAAPADVEQALAKPILEPDLPLVEVQVYTATRVPAIPPVQTADQWQRQAEGLRKRVLDEVVLRGEAARWQDAPARVEWLDTIPTGKGYRLRKLRFEAIPGMWVAAVLYEPERLSGKVVAVLNVNGHEKTGKATPYIQERCINLAKRGILALNPEWLGRGQMDKPGLVHYRLNQIDLCGTSGLSLFYLSLKRSLDILLSLEHTDPQRVAVTGLSGGGWQTIFLSSLDPRVKLANPVAGYSSFVTRAQFPTLDLGDSEQTPSDLATVADYTHLTAMMAPRPTLLTYNAKDDCCFRADYSFAPLIQSARPIFRLFDAEAKLRYHVNHDPGHNYGRDNREAFYRMLRDSFYGGSPDFQVSEIPSADEVRTAEELHVPLPENNEDFHTIALQLSRALPRPGSPDRARLRQVVRARSFRTEAAKVDNSAADGIEVTRWRLRMDADWTVPAVEFTPQKPISTVILVADGGRSSAGPQVRQLLSENKRVLALDPFYFGESKISKRDFLFALQVAAVGDRPLGIQASQVAAAARWLHGERRLGPATVVSAGPRSSLFALVAAAIEPAAISAVETSGAMSSLKEIVEKDLTAQEAPELFCFGLLEEFDIPQIRALVAK